MFTSILFEADMRVIFISCLLFVSVNAFADCEDCNAAHDFLNGTEVYFKSEYSEIDIQKLNLYDKIEVQYLRLVDLPNIKKQFTINERLKSICTDQLNSPEFLSALHVHMKKSLEGYQRFNGNIATLLGLFSAEQLNFSPVLKKVQSHVISLCKNTLTVEIIFNYETVYQSYKSSEDFNFIQIYYFDVTSGNEWNNDDVFSADEKQNFTRALNEKAKQQYTSYLNVLSQTEEIFDEPEPDYTNNELNPADGFAYFNGFQIGFYFFPYHLNSSFYRGNSVTLSFSVDELKQFLNKKGPYASLIKSKTDSKTVLKNMNQPAYEGLNSVSEVYIKYFDGLSDFVGTDKFKTVIIYRINKNKTKDGLLKADTSEIKKLEMNARGKLVSYCQSDRGDCNYRYVIKYNDSGKVIKTATYRNKKLTSAVDYVYDENGNVISKTTSENNFYDENGNSYKRVAAANLIVDEELLYYYGSNEIKISFPLNENNILQYRLLNNDQVVIESKTSPSNSKYFDKWTYKYNSNRKLLAKISSGITLSNNTYLNYNPEGQLSTYETNNGELLREYTYDKHGNMIKEVRSSRDKMFEKRIVEYDENNLPVKVFVTSSSNGASGAEPVIYLLTYQK
ncbi:MAG: hypothetical protein ABIT08_13200 [Bacteroidia bacterium]